MGTLSDRIMSQSIPLDYFESSDAKGVEIHRIGDSPVYSCRNGFTRSLLIDTDEGVAVFDSFTDPHARWLKGIIASHFDAKPVRWLVYSHHHLDHTRGGTLLEPIEVIAHERVPMYLADFDAPTVAAVTTTVPGDAELQFGDVSVEAHYLGLSHTDNLLAFHLPEWRTAFTADLGFVKRLPPFGFPDWYYPGYMRALDRTIAVDFQHLVPTHGDLGTHRDLVDFRTMMADVRESVEAAAARYDLEVANGRNARAIMREVMPGLRDRWGTWAGFDSMMLPLFFRHMGGTYLGF